MVRSTRNVFLGAAAFLASASFGMRVDTRLINGTEVTPGTYKEVIQAKAQGRPGCTATIVGPRTIMTAAHCFANGTNAEFSVNGVLYSAKISRSTIYPAQDHDIAVGLTDKDIVGADMATVGGTASNGLKITLLGYGCTQPQGGGGQDGKLRVGDTSVVELKDLYMRSLQPNGAALCFGDSGGPAFVTENGKRLLLGIASKGNIVDTNFHIRTDLTQTKSFLQAWVAQNPGAEICGVNKDCNGVTPAAPTCDLVAVPQVVNVGQNLSLVLTGKGNFSTATIDGTAIGLTGGIGSKTLTASTVGTFSAVGSISGPGGTSTCQASYTVKKPEDPAGPTCSLAVSPKTVKVGGSVTATLSITSGQATSAMVDGMSVSAAGGSVTISASSVGNKTAVGTVTGAGGTTTCSDTYTVQASDPIDPVTNFDIQVLACGENTIQETNVKEACFANVVYSYSQRNRDLREIVIITYRDGSRDVQPVILRQPGRMKASARAEEELYEELTFYANGMDEEDGKLKLRVRRGLLKTNTSGKPVALQGHTPSGAFFLVSNMKPMIP